MMIWNLTGLLCLVWAATLLYGEMFSFWWPSLSSTCSWPSLPLNGVEHPEVHVKIAVIADPQLTDRTSLPLAPKSLALEIVQFYSDIYMRRAFLASVMPFKPDVVLFLGDYFDGGHLLSDEEWKDSLNRFRHIFEHQALDRTGNHQLYFISGNHDIGYAALHSLKPEVFNRYEREFGLRNYRFTAGKVDFIAIDAQTLDGFPQKNQTITSWNFVKSVSRDSISPLRVLLSHIPLYRADWTSCGPHRSSQVINQRISYDARDHEILYQNYISEESTKSLLNSIKPVLVLSGHDHDQCTVTHISDHGPVVEHTLGTVSWQQGNLYPSFMLISASNRTIASASNWTDAISSQLCFLPAQIFIYLWYLSLFILTLVVTLLNPKNGMRIFLHFGAFPSYVKGVFDDLKAGRKEKNDDENCGYEMVWDAEGSMHLIKKAKNSASMSPSEGSIVERGNAVLRPAAKKQMLQDEDNLTSSDVHIQLGLDEKLKATSNRVHKSCVRRLIQRMVRALRVVTVVAAVNLPIYVLLLFKDWV